MRFLNLSIKVAILPIIILQASIVFASHQGMADYQRQKMAPFQSKVESLKGELMATGPDNWDDAKLSEYGVNACWLIYHAINSYLFTNDELPDSLDDLTSSGLLTEVPGNPLRDWEPIEMLDVSNGFSALDLVMQEAPYQYQSLIGDLSSYILVPQSFQLAVYGPRENHFQGVVGQPKDHNKEWALIPAGILLTVGTVSETAESTLKKLQSYVDSQDPANASEGEKDE